MTFSRLFLLLLICCLLSCQNRSESGFQASLEKSSYSSDEANMSSIESYPETAEPEESQGNSTDNDLSAERKIIRTADIRAEVKDLEQSSREVEAKVKKYRGFLGNVNHTNSYHQKEASFTIRVPSDQFDPLLNDLGKEALYIDYKRISANDVTEEYRDIETRLATKKAVRDRYIDILRNKAQTVEDILNAEDKIRVIQEEIESKEGRLKYLQSQVSLSTIHLNLYQTIAGAKVKQPGFFTQLGRAFKNGWEVFLDLLVGMVNVWPVILILVLILFLLRRGWRSRGK